ncbi:MAG: 30S ribosomal protein S17 [candidate division Zixibacteria bacterium]|nr:30S ribosomal protein S17 [candidate division Zixibacteria bacterium]
MRNSRKIRTGTVKSAKMGKTIVVAVERTLRHPRYGKIIKRTSKVYAHDEKNEAKLGDVVQVMETRPISKTKKWRLTNILEKAK